MTDDQVVALAVLFLAIIVGVAVALTVRHLLVEHRARAVNRSLNADHRPREKP